MMDDEVTTNCLWCNEPFYIKQERLLAPVLQAATPEYAALDKLPFEYIGVSCNFCPGCGRALSKSADGTRMTLAQPALRALTLEELSERTDPVWVETPDAPWIEGGGYYCLCDHGLITPPSCDSFQAKDRKWVFYGRKPSNEQRALIMLSMHTTNAPDTPKER